MSQQQIEPVPQPESKGRKKPLKDILPGGKGFQFYKGEAILDQDKATKLRAAIRAKFPEEHKELIDLAFACLFDEAKKIKRTRPNDPLPELLVAATLRTDWTYEIGAIVAEAMHRFYVARQLAVKFSEYQRYPVEDKHETATAKAIDRLERKKPFAEPQAPFTSFTKEQIDGMIGKILRREKADWSGFAGVEGKQPEPEKDGDGDAKMFSQEDFAKKAFENDQEKKAHEELMEQITAKAKALGIKGGFSLSDLDM